MNEIMCDRCGKATAEVRITMADASGGEVHEIVDLCRRCYDFIYDELRGVIFK
jgi:ribosomal protein L37E